jgi:hypothetical protein
MRPHVSSAVAVAGLLSLPAASAWAQDAGRTVRGEITRVALQESPRRLVVRLEDGSEVDALLADAARVSFKKGVWRYDDPPDVSDLQPGMSVEFKWDPERVDRVLVLTVPDGARPRGGYDQPAEPSWSGPKPTAAYEAGRELPASVLEVSVAAGTLTAEVEGRSQTFLADPRDLRALRKGERVVLVTGEGGRLAAVRPAKPRTP